MSKINLLSSKIFNRIAAGEVVERPASVVKELVENSIDAGAKNITVEIIDGGIASICVCDDGVGIETGDLSKALLPHATSKISSIKDLDCISSLGFRGEALPSIASVSKLNIKSKTKGETEGAEISSFGGDSSPVIPCGIADGTVITVNNIFFNTPAREKFLKTQRAEEGEITSLVARFILGNPDLSFKYIADGKTVYSSYGDGEESAFISVYGAKTLQDCFRVDTEKNGIKIKGYIGKHYFTKGNRTYQTVFVNGRNIVNQTITAAIQNAYSSYLMKRQYPFCVLSISIPNDEVDVNVHPNKMDVRFSNNQIIYGAVYSVISKVLDGSSEALNIVTETQNPFEISKNSNDDFNKQNDTLKKEYDYSSIKNPKFEKIIFKDSGAFSLSNNDNVKSSDSEPVRDIFAENKAYLEKLEKEKELKIVNGINEIKIDRELKYIGQALNTFLIFDDGADLYFIDQHAAHERLNFDKFNLQVENAPVDTQALLVPYLLNLSSEEFAFLDDKKVLLKSMGFDVEEFGRNTFKVSAIPVFLINMDVQKFFKEFLSDLNDLKNISITSLLKEKIAQKACKASVKSGDKLSEEEVKVLLNKLKGNLGLKCPHGRPIAVKIERNEIDKWFKRIV